MPLKLIRNGEPSNLQDHNLLKNLGLNDQHPITAITGLKEALDSKVSVTDFSELVEQEVTPLKSDVELLKTEIIEINSDIDITNAKINDTDTKVTGVDIRVTEIERKIEDGEIGGGGGSGGSGTVSSLKHNVDLEYSEKRLIKETYSGDIQKVVDYTYDDNGNILNKKVTRQDNTVEANYTYDASGNLIKIIDGGTDEIYLTGVGGIATYISQIETVNKSTLTKVVDFKTLCTINEIEAILNSELLIQNTSELMATLIVTQSGIELINVNINPQSTQKYILGNSKNISISILGNLYYEFTLNGVKTRGTGTGGIDQEEVTNLINSIIIPKFDLIKSSIKDLQLGDMKMQFKYDEALNLDANYTGNYYIDSKLDVEKEGE